MMPNRKTDTNNRWGFSTNKTGINYEFPDGNYSRRASTIEEQEFYQKGLTQIYVREARRLVGEYVTTYQD